MWNRPAGEELKSRGAHLRHRSLHRSDSRSVGNIHHKYKTARDFAVGRQRDDAGIVDDDGGRAGLVRDDRVRRKASLDASHPRRRLQHMAQQQIRFWSRQQVAELQPAEELSRFGRRRRVTLRR